MISERARAAIEAAAARENARSPEEQAKLDLLLLLMTHRFMCCPFFKDGRLYHPPAEERPAINGPGCFCKGEPMTYLGPSYFLALNNQKDAA